MKKGIHPNYRPVVFQDAAANFSFLTRSCVETDETIKWTDGKEYPLYKLDISSASHPFFTGKMKLVDTTGRVQKFQDRYKKSKASARPRPTPRRRRTRRSEFQVPSSRFQVHEPQRRRSVSCFAAADRRPAESSTVRTWNLKPGTWNESHVCRTRPEARALPRARTTTLRPRDRHRSGPVRRHRQGTRALAKIVEPYLELQQLDAAIKDAEGMLAGETPDLRAMAEEELARCGRSANALHAKIEDQLLVDPAEDFAKLIVEIRAGDGGDEAALFAGDLYEMYTRYARAKGWAVEAISLSPGEAGGFKEIIFSVTGDDVYQYPALRVRRAPRAARAEDRDAGPHPHVARHGRGAAGAGRGAGRSSPQDIEWERMRAGGAGGQHVNKTESAVRIWYRKGTPDEMEVKCQDERSQHKNYDRAMRILRTRLFERQQEKLHQSRADARKSQVGTGDRGAKIRTYHFKETPRSYCSTRLSRNNRSARAPVPCRRATRPSSSSARAAPI